MILNILPEKIMVKAAVYDPLNNYNNVEDTKH